MKSISEQILSDNEYIQQKFTNHYLFRQSLSQKLFYQQLIFLSVTLLLFLDELIPAGVEYQYATGVGLKKATILAGYGLGVEIISFGVFIAVSFVLKRRFDDLSEGLAHQLLVIEEMASLFTFILGLLLVGLALLMHVTALFGTGAVEGLLVVFKNPYTRIPAPMSTNSVPILAFIFFVISFVSHSYFKYFFFRKTGI